MGRVARVVAAGVRQETPRISNLRSALGGFGIWVPSGNTVDLRRKNDNFNFPAFAVHGGARAQRVVAHFALDAARAAVSAAGNHPLLQQFVENLLMKRFSSPRGE